MGDFVAEFSYPADNQLINYIDNVVLSYTSNYSATEPIKLTIWSRSDANPSQAKTGSVYDSMAIPNLLIWTKAALTIFVVPRNGPYQIDDIQTHAKIDHYPQKLWFEIDQGNYKKNPGMNLRIRSVTGVPATTWAQDYLVVDGSTSSYPTATSVSPGSTTSVEPVTTGSTMSTLTDEASSPASVPVASLAIADSSAITAQTTAVSPIATAPLAVAQSSTNIPQITAISPGSISPTSQPVASSSGHAQGLSSTAKAGLGAGLGVAGIILIIALIFLCVRRRRAAEANERQTIPPPRSSKRYELPVPGPDRSHQAHRNSISKDTGLTRPCELDDTGRRGIGGSRGHRSSRLGTFSSRWTTRSHNIPKQTAVTGGGRLSEKQSSSISDVSQTTLSGGDVWAKAVRYELQGS
ncbi:MAG: hypothetical protein Q9227_003199 [Pyrenula ochraceoflavens]